MRNIFDQYRHPENQLSHALATVLSMERKLCSRFVRWLTGGAISPQGTLLVDQQRIPGVAFRETDEEDRDGLPDLCIQGGGDWCLAIEVKVTAPLTTDQLRRHGRTVGRYFENAHVAAITAGARPRYLPAELPHRTWEDVYVWCGEQPERNGLWVKHLRDFMRVLESRLVAEGTPPPASLTMFDGIPFGEEHPYSYREAKLLIRQAVPLLRARKGLIQLGTDPNCTGRPAITGRGSSGIWDFISLRPPGMEGGFTLWPHLTFGIHETMTEVMVTVPNSIKSSCQREFRKLEEEGFIELCAKIEKNLRKVFGSRGGYKPVMRIVHRHYPSQRSEAVLDGEMEVDLRTARGDGPKGIKMQTHWFAAAYQLMTDKAGCNMQLQVGVYFPHIGEIVRSSDAVDRIEEGWLACEPLITILLPVESD